jgi:Na+-transporting NADH:ubiquinone oxidoreductase subunit D
MAKTSAANVFRENLGVNNPVFVQVLGICSTLAVTNVLKNTVVMCLGLVFATTLTNVTVSAMRRGIPTQVRMMVELLVAACYVIIVDIVLKAYAPDVSKQLGPYVGLIITNCILMGRAEACALTNPPWIAFADGVSSSLGYSYVLMAIAVVRELFGSGTFWGLPVMPAGWVNWSIMVMAPGGFFMLAIFMWLVKHYWLKPAAAPGGKPNA